MQSIILPSLVKEEEGAVSPSRLVGEGVPKWLLPLLPPPVASAVERYERGERKHRIEEVRLRREGAVTFTTDRGAVFPGIRLTGKEMDDTFTRLSGGSFYQHSETIGEGYLLLKEGIRVGISGRAAVERGRVIGVYDPSSIVIRIPSSVAVSGETVASLFERSIREGKGGGILLYAKPGVGKTTLLAATVACLAGGDRPAGCRQVAVVDTRGEIGALLSARRKEDLTVDLLTGYPRAVGIEIATRTLGAEVIAIDEIGSPSEAEAISGAQNAGVPLIATAHADSLPGLLRRPGIRLLHRSAVFGHYVGIRRAAVGFSYRITPYEEVDLGEGAE